MAQASQTNAHFNGSVTITGITIEAGTGVPTHSATRGSLYSRIDGSTTSTRLYINTNGSTAWTNVTTAI